MATVLSTVSGLMVASKFFTLSVQRIQQPVPIKTGRRPIMACFSIRTTGSSALPTTAATAAAPASLIAAVRCIG
jgi:hypothetical protein